MPKSPVVASWELALRLRQRRERMGIDASTLTKSMGFSRNHWSAIENQRKIPSDDSLSKVIDLLEFDQDERKELLELRDITRQRSWWAEYSGILHPEIQRLYGLEYGAESFRTYENLLVPGLLQTKDYSRAIIAPNVTVRRVDVEQFIEVRLRRQERLSGEDPLHLTAVISEAVLWQEIGGPVVLRDQLKHLEYTVKEHENSIELRVIPFTAKNCTLFGSATIHVLDFASPRLPTVVWQETVTAFGIIDDAEQVRDISTAYDETIRISLSPQDSLTMIHERIEELG